MNNKGITLIALVITIIVLLILAGVSIVTLTGQNGIILKANTASEETRKKNYEEILKIIGNGLRPEKVINQWTSKTYLDEFENEIPKYEEFHAAQINRKNDEIIIVTTKEGYVYKITENEVKIKLPIVGNLEDGDIINYIDKNGNVIKCAVLWNMDSSYGKDGIEIVSLNPISDLKLGSWAGDPWGSNLFATWNKSFNILNSFVRDYLNTSIALSARCIGSNPSNPSKDTAGVLLRGGTFTGEKIRIKLSDENYVTDYEQLKKLGIANSSKEYWLCSRYCEADNNEEFASFVLRSVQTNGDMRILPSRNECF